jgi:hypothetical protein
MKAYFYACLVVICFYGVAGNAQVNFLGKPGHITIPSAEWESKTPLGASFSYIPREYTNGMFFTSTPMEQNTLHFYNISIGLTSFMDVNFSIAHRPLLSYGIGDRQLDFRFRLIQETRLRPSIVLGITPPGSSSPVLSHDYLVVTKNINTSIGTFRITGGYGSPYVIFNKKSNSQNFWQELKIEKKAVIRSGNNYLTGIFGGITYLPVDFGGVIIEYNTTTINAGAFVKLWDWLQLQGYTYEGKKAAFTIVANFPLNFKPNTLRKHEKSLD